MALAPSIKEQAATVHPVGAAGSLATPVYSPMSVLRGMLEKKDYVAATAFARKAVTQSPTDPAIWNALGLALRAIGEAQSAAQCYQNALAIAPRSAAIWSNLGNALVDSKKFALGLAAHERARALAPDDAKVMYNHGLALAANGSHVASLELLNRTHEMMPDDPNVVWDRARAHLHLGNYARGWQDYEARLRTGHLPPRALPGAPWDGQPYRGKRLLILSEQGFGDAIWVARWLPAVKALGGTLIVEARRELVSLFEQQSFADRIVAKGDSLPDADFHLHQCSLPKLFARSASTISSRPYLRIHEAHARRFAEIFDDRRQGLRVGIVWSGSVTFKGNSDRAQPLQPFLDWFDMPGVRLFSLQKGPPEVELRAIGSERAVDLSLHLKDFADTAAALMHLDLVVMTDSAVAHLAGALGRPVWVLLGKNAHWLWSPETDRTLWYQTMRLFRPKAWGDWRTVFDHAAAALLKLQPTNAISSQTAELEKYIERHEPSEY